MLLGRKDLEYNTRKINEKCIEIDNKINYGSYNNMIDTYRKLYKYIYENGYEVCGEPIDKVPTIENIFKNMKID